jgi:monofunctional glycosyltransferase
MTAPVTDAEIAPAPQTRKSTPISRRVMRWALLIVALVLLTPYVITPLYRSVNPVSTLMMWRYLTGGRVQRTVLPLDRVAPDLRRFVITSEDDDFCSHDGIPWPELARALARAQKQHRSYLDISGTSGISQQVAKNLFLWSGRSLVRKALEFPLAMWIDYVLGKRRVLEIYLNIAEWGPDGEFGAEAGAQRAFKKPASDLTFQQSALLAAILPYPRRSLTDASVLRKAGGLQVNTRNTDASCADVKPYSGPPPKRRPPRR